MIHTKEKLTFESMGEKINWHFSGREYYQDKWGMYIEKIGGEVNGIEFIDWDKELKSRVSIGSFLDMLDIFKVNVRSLDKVINNGYKKVEETNFEDDEDEDITVADALTDIDMFDSSKILLELEKVVYDIFGEYNINRNREDYLETSFEGKKGKELMNTLRVKVIEFASSLCTKVMEIDIVDNVYIENTQSEKELDIESMSTEELENYVLDN